MEVPAPLNGQLQPTIYRFKLGGFEVATVLDAKAIRDGLYPHYGANASADEVHALARANNIDTQRFEHPNIPTLVNTGKQLVRSTRAMVRCRANPSNSASVCRLDRQ